MGEAHEYVRTHLLGSAEVQRRAAESCTDGVVQAALVMTAAVAGGGKILMCGNGGSAADCQHMATELVSRLTAGFTRPAIPAIALTTDTSLLTGFSNDFDFAGVFARQVDALGKPGDVLLAISTSGRSANVRRAAARARSGGLTVVALTGCEGPLGELADVAIRVPSSDVQHIQESHLAIEHALCHLIESSLYAMPEGSALHGSASRHSSSTPREQ